MGRISHQAAEELMRLIDESCGQIDEEGWLTSPESFQ
jgi:hypothetical protein